MNGKNISKLISLLFIILTMLFSCDTTTTDKTAENGNQSTTDTNKPADKEPVDDDKPVVENPSDKEPVEDDKPVVDSNKIDYDSEPNGTLKIANNTDKDMVVFLGQTPSVNNVLGGVKAGSNRFFDVADDVDDFDVGGYLILRAMSEDEYTKNKSNLSRAKIEYSAMATYGKGRKFSTEINPSYTGNYIYKITNNGKIGIELRKNSADGEKIGYVPALTTNYVLYSDTQETLTIFPVYVYYSKLTGTVNAVKSNDDFDSTSVHPVPLDASEIPMRYFPTEGTKWEDIVNSLSSPVAYITCINNVPNQNTFLTKSASSRLISQSGYDSLNSGELDTYEIASSDEGINQNLVVTLYNGSIMIPVKDAEGNSVLIKNGFDYTITISYNGQGIRDSANYSAIIVEGAKRDLSDEIESL